MTKRLTLLLLSLLFLPNCGDVAIPQTPLSSSNPHRTKAESIQPSRSMMRIAGANFAVAQRIDGNVRVLRRSPSALPLAKSRAKAAKNLRNLDSVPDKKPTHDAVAIARSALKEIAGGATLKYLKTSRMILGSGQLIQNVLFEPRIGGLRSMDHSVVRVLLVDGVIEKIVGQIPKGFVPKAPLVSRSKAVSMAIKAATSAAKAEAKTRQAGEFKVGRVELLANPRRRSLGWSVELSGPRGSNEQAVLIDAMKGAVLKRMPIGTNGRVTTSFKVRGSLNDAKKERFYGNGVYVAVPFLNTNYNFHFLFHDYPTDHLAVFDGGPLWDDSQPSSISMPFVWNTDPQFNWAFSQGSTSSEGKYLFAAQHAYYWAYRAFTRFYWDMMQKVEGAEIKHVALLTNMPGEKCGIAAYRGKEGAMAECPKFFASNPNYYPSSELTRFIILDGPRVDDPKVGTDAEAITNVSMLLHEYGHHVDNMYGGYESKIKWDFYCKDYIRSPEINACVFQVAVLPGLTGETFNYHDYDPALVGVGCTAPIKLKPDWTKHRSFGDFCSRKATQYDRNMGLMQAIFATAANMKLSEGCVEKTDTNCALNSSSTQAAQWAREAVAYMLALTPTAPTQGEAADLFIEFYEFSSTASAAFPIVKESFKNVGHTYQNWCPQGSSCADAPPEFELISGQNAVDVASNGGAVWIVSNAVKNRNSNGNKIYRLVNGTFIEDTGIAGKQIAADPAGKPCVVDSAGLLHCKDSSSATKGSWTNISGLRGMKFQDAAFSDAGELRVITDLPASGGFTIMSYLPTSGAWSQLPGGAMRVGACGTTWIVDSNNNVFALDGGQWVPQKHNKQTIISVRAKDIDCGGNGIGQPFAISLTPATGGYEVQSNGPGIGYWHPFANFGATNVSIGGDGVVYAINNAGLIFKLKE